MLRHNEFYATTRFSTAIRLGVQLAFLLDKGYFPYDKWLMAYFERLPRMVGRMGDYVYEAVKLSTPWERKLDLLHQISDVLDAAMVEDGIIRPHPKFAVSPTSGYRSWNMPTPKSSRACLLNSRPSSLSGIRSIGSRSTAASWTASICPRGTRCCS